MDDAVIEDECMAELRTVRPRWGSRYYGLS